MLLDSARFWQDRQNPSNIPTSSLPMVTSGHGSDNTVVDTSNEEGDLDDELNSAGIIMDDIAATADNEAEERTNNVANSSAETLCGKDFLVSNAEKQKL